MRRSALNTLLPAVIAVAALGATGHHSVSAQDHTHHGHEERHHAHDHAPDAIDGTTIEALAAETLFYGLVVDRGDPSQILLATEQGLYAARLDGTARRVSETRDFYMGLAAHPNDPHILFASGHPPEGGNLGFVVSEDGGITWHKRADGVDGPVDFHEMDVSKANPQVIYGIYGTLQRSTDGGHSWESVGRPPAGITQLAASSLDEDTLYAATQQGLLKSTDAGRRWGQAHWTTLSATMVDVTPDGTVHAFVTGIGLVRADEENLDWETLSEAAHTGIIEYFAADPGNETRYAITIDPGTNAQSVIASRDGGKSWLPLGTD